MTAAAGTARNGSGSAGTAPAGLIVVDKPGGMTSHDVVARIRRLAGTRKVGHAGTLDPMATGVLIVGVQQATRLLGHLALTEKEYIGTIRLGQSTSTDDAEGEIVGQAPPGAVAAVTPDALAAAAAALTGAIEQVPPGVSAIKVSGQRAYKLTRAGAAPELAARPVTVSRLEVTALRAGLAGDTSASDTSASDTSASDTTASDTTASDRSDREVLDADIAVTCSSGTYIRALARDLGAALGTGGHLTALRRTRVGPYRASDAATLDELAAGLRVVPLAEAAGAAFARRDLTAEQATAIGHGQRLAAAGSEPGPVAAFGPDGALVALLTQEDGQARSLAVFAPAG